MIPAALSVAESTGATREELRAAIVVGYEVAIRAGLDLHARSREYHASGAWGALGAAAAAGRLLALDETRMRHALGLAGYHAPIAPIMRSVADPAMTKDACAWGALVGVSSALLARDGFTALGNDVARADVGARWHLLDVYVKKFPCCRWSHPAIEAALHLRAGLADADEIARVRIRTFAAAAALASRPPATTEEAQYSLIWPVAVALAHRAFEVEHVLEPAFDDAASQSLLSRIDVEVDPALDALFPESRLAQVTIKLRSGEMRESEPTESPGEADDPLWREIIDEKFARFGAAQAARAPLSLLGLGDAAQPSPR